MEALITSNDGKFYISVRMPSGYEVVLGHGRAEDSSIAILSFADANTAKTFAAQELGLQVRDHATA